MAALGIRADDSGVESAAYVHAPPGSLVTKLEAGTFKRRVRSKDFPPLSVEPAAC